MKGRRGSPDPFAKRSASDRYLREAVIADRDGGWRDLTDIAAIEAVPLSERALPEITYAALVASAKRTPDAKALSFFLSGDRLDETRHWTYAELIADVTRQHLRLQRLDFGESRDPKASSHAMQSRQTDVVS